MESTFLIEGGFMPLLNVRLIEGVFTAEQKREMIRPAADVYALQGRAPAPVAG
jgi:phenylpyruvate tautomerase PptA (4-oxalocrotonate tautomerase family)